MLLKKIIERGRGYKVYQVEGDIHLYTDEAIADKCDCNNFGYYTIYRDENIIEIKIYID